MNSILIISQKTSKCLKNQRFSHVFVCRGSGRSWHFNAFWGYFWPWIVSEIVSKSAANIVFDTNADLVSFQCQIVNRIHTNPLTMRFSTNVQMPCNICKNALKPDWPHKNSVMFSFWHYSFSVLTLSEISPMRRNSSTASSNLVCVYVPKVISVSECPIR